MAWLIFHLLDTILPHRPKLQEPAQVKTAFQVAHERRMRKRRELEQLKAQFRMPAYDPEAQR